MVDEITDMNDKKGAVMVEAVIVFPIVLLTVFTLIYLGLFKLQEMAMLYQVQRVVFIYFIYITYFENRKYAIMSFQE